ncbi:MAG: cell division protein FtsZ [Acidobacteriia bacterium]|nr:cell division protein FtsZ [Terriglobia bacterium]MYK11817.1 cell division protein FtsZ [Terriglobia bacterium]
MTDIREPLSITLEPVESDAKPAVEQAKFVRGHASTNAICIKVVGIGGCGGNILNTLISNGLDEVDFIAVNTDAQALQICDARTKLQIGERTTQGHGTGSNPEVGKQSALENTEELTELLSDADMVFVIVGLGGGTGTGATPVIASLAKQLGALTVAAAIKPFGFEGSRRARIADQGLDKLVETVDTTIVIQNEQLLGQLESGTGFFEGFQVAHQIVSNTLQGLTSVLSKRGIINTDFADVRAVLEDSGVAIVGTAQRSGRDAATQAARDAIASPVMEVDGLSQARKVLVNIAGSTKFGMQDATEALHLIQREVSSEAELIIGVVQDNSMGDLVAVMVIASGFAQEGRQLPFEDDVQAKVLSDTRTGSSWNSERATELFRDDPLPEMAPEASVHDLEYVSGAETPVGDEPGVRRQVAASGLSGSTDELPELVPPATVAAEEADKERKVRSGFFGRRSIFR